MQTQKLICQKGFALASQIIKIIKSFQPLTLIKHRSMNVLSPNVNQCLIYRLGSAATSRPALQDSAATPGRRCRTRLLPPAGAAGLGCYPRPVLQDSAATPGRRCRTRLLPPAGAAGLGLYPRPALQDSAAAPGRRCRTRLLPPAGAAGLGCYPRPALQDSVPPWTFLTSTSSIWRETYDSGQHGYCLSSLVTEEDSMAQRPAGW